MIANSPSRLEAWLATALALLLAWGVVTLWVPGGWAVATVQVGIYLLTAIWVVAALRFKLHLHFHAVMIPLGGAVLWGVLQLATGTTIYRWSTEVATLDWFTRLAVFFLVFQIFDSLTLRRRLLDWFLWFGFALAVLASLQRFTTPKEIFWLFAIESSGNVMGPFIYHNQYAAFVELVLPVSLLAARQRWTYAVIPAVLIASVIAANSRAGAFLVIAEFALILVLWKLRGHQPARLAVVAAALVVLFAASMGWGPLVEKFQRRDQYGPRRDLLSSSLEMARERPWVGFGLATWSTAYPAYARFDDGLFDNQAHNDWAQWAAEGGVPFLLLMLLMAGLLTRPAMRTVWGVGLLAVLVHCFVDYHFQQRPVFGYVYFALASVCALAAKHDTNRARQNVKLEPE